VSIDSDELIRDIIRDAHSGRERSQDERVLAGLFGAVMVRARDEYDGEADLVIATLRAAGWRPPAKVVATIDETHSLPPGTRLYSERTGDVWWRREGERPAWQGSNGAYSYTSALIDYEGPLTVIHVPGGSHHA
jgi:hypothetical protein